MIAGLAVLKGGRLIPGIASALPTYKGKAGDKLALQCGWPLDPTHSHMVVVAKNIGA